MNTSQAAKGPKVEVVSLRLVEKAGGLKGFAAVKIGPLQINDCRLIQASESQAAFVSPPQREYTDGQGARQFFPLCQWPREWGYAISRAVTEAWADHPEGIAEVRPARAGYPPRPATRTAFGEAIRDNAGIGGGQ